MNFNIICARRPCQLSVMSSLKWRWATTDMSQGTININYTLGLYCRQLRTMDESRATNYHHVLNSAIQFDVLMSHWQFPTATRLEKSATTYMTGYIASLFRSFLLLILQPSRFLMFAEFRYKFIYAKLIKFALCVDISLHTWCIKKVSYKTYVKIMFFFRDVTIWYHSDPRRKYKNSILNRAIISSSHILSISSSTYHPVGAVFRKLKYHQCLK